MSIFKNIKSLFIIEDETGKEQAAEPEAAEAVEDKKELMAPRQQAPAGEVNARFTDILAKAMQKHNLEGFDYLEYKQSLRSLRKMNMDEPTRYKSAYAMAQTMGVTPEQLTKTAQHYIDVLHAEEQKFEQALKKQQREKIAAREKHILQLEEKIQARQQEIQKLQQEITNNQAAVEKEKQKMKMAGQKIAQTQSDFVASFNAIVGQISHDIENMKKYLK